MVPRSEDSDLKYWYVMFIITFSLIVIILVLIILLARVRVVFGAMDFLIISLASFRLIRLFTYDKIMAFVRDYFGGYKSGPKKAFYEMLICPWCTGIWMALFMVVVYMIPGGKILAIILAVAGIASLIQVFANMVGRKGKMSDKIMKKS